VTKRRLIHFNGDWLLHCEMERLGDLPSYFPEQHNER
jgi:hypothetical protein